MPGELFLRASGYVMRIQLYDNDFFEKFMPNQTSGLCLQWSPRIRIWKKMTTSHARLINLSSLFSPPMHTSWSVLYWWGLNLNYRNVSQSISTTTTVFCGSEIVLRWNLGAWWEAIWQLECNLTFPMFDHTLYHSFHLSLIHIHISHTHSVTLNTLKKTRYHQSANKTN